LKESIVLCDEYEEKIIMDDIKTLSKYLEIDMDDQNI
jgi:hypothetical protein